MSVAAINQKITEAVDAQEAGDFDTAISKLRSAKMLMSGKPDTEFETERLIWDRNAIDAAIADMRRAQASQAGIVQVDAVHDLNTRHCGPRGYCR